MFVPMKKTQICQGRILSVIFNLDGFVFFETIKVGYVNQKMKSSSVTIFRLKSQ